jgi:protein-disulfide isomerase
MIRRLLWPACSVVAAGLLAFAQEIPRTPPTKVLGNNTTGSTSSTVSTIAAVVNGKVITFDELDSAIAQQLQDLEERRYRLRRAALEQRINQLLLEEAAKSRGLSIPSLILSRTPAVSESDVEAYYRRNEDRLPSGTEYAVKEQIRESLEKEAKQRAYRDTIREIRSGADITVFLRRPAIAPSLFGALTGPSLGPDTAPLRLVVFSDYQCEFCRKSQETLNSLLSKYDGQIQLVHKFLVPKDNPAAVLIAKAALCAAKQQAFWKYHHSLFAESPVGSVQWLSQLAGTIGLDRVRFDSCLASDELQSVIDRDRKDAALVGARATPFFLLNGQVFRGIQPLEEFDQAIKQLLRDNSCARTTDPNREQAEQ